MFQLTLGMYLPSKLQLMVKTKHLALLSIGLLSFLSHLGQENNSFYFYAQFKAKTNSGLLASPEVFLTERAIQRREKSNISIIEQDLPISTNRIQAIEKVGNIKVHYPLKWSNGLVFSSPDTTIDLEVAQLAFVDTVFVIKKKRTGKRSAALPPVVYDKYNYGLATDQTELINLPHLHQFGYRGKGVSIAVFDNGFQSIDTFPLFRNLWEENRILGQYDIIDGDKNPIPHGSHGRAVLSCMGALSSDTMTGTAPEATYHIFRTEDNASETLLEEYNWARAAEIADSLGADIINSSLGYSTFEDTTTSHSYDDLDGKTTVVTKAANTAYRKGILVVNSAGNSGNKAWRYVIAPADGRYVLSVGATDSVGNLASFSSRGPNAAGLLKPNIVAVGARVIVANAVGGADQSNGTSFSAPTIAGAAACLIQAFPEASNSDIFRAIEASADRYDFPDFNYGYGIPDFKRAFDILAREHENQEMDQRLIRDFNLYPNPSAALITIEFVELQETEVSVSISDYHGNQLLNQQLGPQWGATKVSVNIEQLSAGFYVIELERGSYVQRKVFVKY